MWSQRRGPSRTSRRQEPESSLSLSHRKGTASNRLSPGRALVLLFLCTWLSPLCLLGIWISTTATSSPRRNQEAITASAGALLLDKGVSRKNTENLVKGNPKPSIIFCGVVRNVDGFHLQSQIPKMAELGRVLSGEGNFHILVYENDSDPGTDTRQALQELLDGKPYGTLLFEDNVESNNHVDGIARARNKVLEVVEERFAKDYEYLIMTDMDAVCGGADGTKSYDPEVFQYAFQHADEWDAVSFRFLPYWDLWAFRHPEWMPNNMYIPVGGPKNPIRNPESMDLMLDQLPRKEFIPVTSAFMVLSIYKMNSIVGGRYSAVGLRGDKDCEHVAFHRSIAEKHQARIRVLPLVYCVGDEGYFPLKEQLAM